PRAPLDARLLGLEGGHLDLPRGPAPRAQGPRDRRLERLPRAGPDRPDRRHPVPQPGPDDGAGGGRPPHRAGRRAPAARLCLPDPHVARHGADTPPAQLAVRPHDDPGRPPGPDLRVLSPAMNTELPPLVSDRPTAATLARCLDCATPLVGQPECPACGRAYRQADGILEAIGPLSGRNRVAAAVYYGPGW